MRAAILAGAVSCLLATGANAQWYTSASAGYAVPAEGRAKGQRFNCTSNEDPGWVTYAALGYKFPVGMRFEGEAGYSRFYGGTNTCNGKTVNYSADTHWWSGTLNGFFDINTGTAFTPYFGAGLGTTYSRTSGVNINGTEYPGNSKTFFTPLGEVGINYAATKHTGIGLSYRYIVLFGHTDADADVSDTGLHVFKLNAHLSF